MFLLFGYGVKRKHLGSGAIRLCANCHNTTEWARMRQFTQLTMFFIPVARWKRRQFEQCGICGATAGV